MALDWKLWQLDFLLAYLNADLIGDKGRVDVKLLMKNCKWLIYSSAP